MARLARPHPNPPPFCGGGSRSQRPMHRLAEQRRVVAAIVQAHDVEMVDIGAFEQVERGGRLAEGPQLRQRHAEDPAQQDAVDRVMRDHQQRLVRPQSRARSRERRPRAVQHVLQRLALRHQHLVRGMAPRLHQLGIAGPDFLGEQAFPGAVRDFLETLVEGQHRRAFLTECELRRACGAYQRRGDGAIDAHLAEPFAERARLYFADRRQRDVFLALVAALGVPRSFAVACEQYLHAYTCCSESTPGVARRVTSCGSLKGWSTVIAARAWPSPAAPSAKLTMLIPAAPSCEPTVPIMPGRSSLRSSSTCACGSNSISTPSRRTTRGPRCRVASISRGLLPPSTRIRSRRSKPSPSPPTVSATTRPRAAASCNAFTGVTRPECVPSSAATSRRVSGRVSSASVRPA